MELLKRAKTPMGFVRLIPSFLSRVQTSKISSASDFAELGNRIFETDPYQDSFYHVERYTQLATKLFNMANQDLQALLNTAPKGNPYRCHPCAQRRTGNRCAKRFFRKGVGAKNTFLN